MVEGILDCRELWLRGFWIVESCGWGDSGLSRVVVEGILDCRESWLRGFWIVESRGWGNSGLSRVMVEGILDCWESWLREFWIVESRGWGNSGLSRVVVEGILDCRESWLREFWIVEPLPMLHCVLRTLASQEFNPLLWCVGKGGEVLSGVKSTVSNVSDYILHHQHCQHWPIQTTVKIMVHVCTCKVW